MTLSDESGQLTREGCTDDAQPKYGEAFEFERCAAIACIGDDLARSRAILHRSAAWLGIKAGRLRDAEAIATRGLSFDDVPDGAAWDLREVLVASWGDSAKMLLKEQDSG